MAHISMVYYWLFFIHKTVYYWLFFIHKTGTSGLKRIFGICFVSRTWTLMRFHDLLILYYCWNGKLSGCNKIKQQSFNMLCTLHISMRQGFHFQHLQVILSLKSSFLFSCNVTPSMATDYFRTKRAIEWNVLRIGLLFSK